MRLLTGAGHHSGVVTAIGPRAASLIELWQTGGPPHGRPAGRQTNHGRRAAAARASRSSLWSSPQQLHTPRHESNPLRAETARALPPKPAAGSAVLFFRRERICRSLRRQGDILMFRRERIRRSLFRRSDFLPFGRARRARCRTACATPLALGAPARRRLFAAEGRAGPFGIAARRFSTDLLLDADTPRCASRS